MSKAKDWAVSYFQRLEQTMEALSNHPLIENIHFVRFPGATEQLISQTEEALTEALQTVAEDNGLDAPEAYQMDGYMKAFYEISNGLYIAWDSHLYETTLTGSRTIVDGTREDFKVAEDDLLQAEGFLSLLPMENFASYINLPLYGDPADSSLGEELKGEGVHLTYFDYFSGYHDTAIGFTAGNAPDLLYLGEDHSASYDSDPCSDFVVYMEHMLNIRFSVFLRHKAFHGSDEIEAFRSSGYENIAAEITSESDFNSIEDVLKHHALEEELLEKFGDIEYLQAKPDEIYAQIEEMLDVVLEDEIF